MDIDIKNVADYACVCGEGPIWHALDQKLYWADIPKGRLYRYDPATNEHGQVHEARLLGAVTVQADGSLLLLRDHGNVVCLRNGELHTIIDEISGESAFNDGIADPEGRVFSGTCGTDKSGSLYRIDPDGAYRAVHENVGCSNGLGFSIDLKRMYYTDSNDFSIYVFDYDRAAGEIENPRVFVRTDPRVKPDGLTVDSEDHVWSAQWEGGCVMRYKPDGTLVQKIEIPTRLITSVMFGGPDLDELYVTSAGGDDKKKNGPEAGSLFRITGLGVKGRLEFLSRIGL